MTDSPSDDATRDAAGMSLARRSMLGAAALVPVMAAMAARPTAALAAGAAPFPTHPRWKFVFVNHVTTNPFFVPTQYGIQDACGLLGCDFQWAGSANADVGEMVNAVNAAIASKASAIATCIVDPKAFDKPIANALAAGIPVFSYNADAPAGGGNQRLAYIGQDLYKSGVAMGEKIVGMIDSGTVALFIATPGQLNIQPRLDGASDVIKKSGKQITIDVIATGATVNEELSKVKAYYLGHQDVKGMFAVDGGTTQGIAQTMKQYDLVKKGVHGGGFDLLPGTMQLIKGRLPGLHHRPAAVPAGLLHRDPDVHLPGLGWPVRPGRDQYRPEVRDQGERWRLSVDQDALRG